MQDYRRLYSELRNYLAGQHLGSTRDEALIQEVVKALLCKAELDAAGGVKRPSAAPSEYRQAWHRARARFPRLLRGEKPLAFADAILLHMDTLLSPVDLHDHRHDPLGDLYEVFTGSLAKGQQGQFFTPSNAVDLLVDLVKPQPGEVILDPACGAGGFLAATVRHMMQQGELTASAVSNLWGIDKDNYLGHLAALRIALLTGNEASIWCADSLAWRSVNGSVSALEAFDRADVILTNPPFGAKIVALAPEIQRTFALGHRWTLDKTTGRYAKTPDLLLRSISPQVAFVERCIELLAPGGRLGMVIPESLLSSTGHGYVVQFIRDHLDIQAVLGMPDTLFKTSGSGGTHTKTCLLIAQKRTAQGKDRKLIFMAEAKWCGNDSRGRRIGPDELPKISERYHMESKARPIDHLSYEIPPDAIKGNILVPRYYDPEVFQMLASLHETHELVNIGALIESGVLEVRSGDEIGRENYGTGDIPFVRTSDISNWEIKLDPKHGISEDVYSALAAKQDVREGDILMVRDGTYLIGTCAYVTKYDQKIVYQSHILKLRVLKPEVLSPYILLASLTSIPVKRQIIAKRFTQDIIDSLGGRITEIQLPVPRDPKLRARVADKVRSAISDRMEARELARQACLDVIGIQLAADEV